MQHTAFLLLGAALIISIVLTNMPVVMRIKQHDHWYTIIIEQPY